MLLVINYHYIGPDAHPFPGIHPVPASILKTQIETIGQYFEYVNEEDLLQALAGQRRLPERACLLTFDDGLRCQYELAGPVLEECGVSGIFFVSGRPIAERRPLEVHRIHWFRSQVPPEDFLGRLRSASRAFDLGERLESAGNRLHGKYFFDDEATAQAKLFLNAMVSPQEQARLLDHIEQGAELDSRDYFDDLYMTRAQITDTARRFAVGAHGYAHLPLGSLDRGAAAEDIGASIATLRDMSIDVHSIGYPYGYADAVTQVTLDLAREAGLALGFTTERALNLSLAKPLAMARVDTNDAPEGKRPIINCTGSEISVTAPITPGRRRYVEERNPPPWVVDRSGDDPATPRATR